MILLALIAFLGVLLLGGLYALVMTRRGHRLAAVGADVQQQLAGILKRAEQADHAFAADLERGADFGEALAHYQASRAALLPVPVKTDQPWNWEADDLDRWQTEERTRRCEAVNRNLLIPALGGALLIIAIIVTIIAVLYESAVSRPSFTPASPSPVVQPPQTISLPPLAPSTPSAPQGQPSIGPMAPSSSGPSTPQVPASVDPGPGNPNP